MAWLVLSYSLPSGGSSSPRVTLWRRLHRLGAISTRGGVHVLPAREDCAEAFNWISQEVKQLKGDCLVMRVEGFEGLTDQELVELFRENAEKSYEELDEQISALEKKARGKLSSEEKTRIQPELEKLRKKHAEISRIDFFDAKGGLRIAARISALEDALFKSTHEELLPPRVAKKDFQRKTWVTRPRPHVDRLACAWLIRRYIDAKATIKYSSEPQKGEIAFDMKKGGTFGHVGNLCTFETMIIAFDLSKDAGLNTLAKIIHEIDLRDCRYMLPEVAGVDAILTGWLLNDHSDAELEKYGLVLFDGLYADIMRKEKTAQGKSKR